MSENNQSPSPSSPPNFQEVTAIVAEEFQIEEALVEFNVPTYQLKQPQATKKPFLRLLKKLKPSMLTAFLRRKNKKIILKIVPKPPIKQTNVMINWILFFATIGTTFLTGYILSLGILELGGEINPILGGVTFTIAIMGILGLHEMGHKVTADKAGIEATPPYFIPGPPPIFGLFGIGTFGAVILQKDLPPNRDALFDVGSRGPLAGFIITVIVTALGMTMSISAMPSEELGILPPTLLWILLSNGLSVLGLLPQSISGQILLVHPVGLAGWVGMIITMLNLLPAAMLDGGHIARSVVSEKARSVLTAASIIMLVLSGFWPMAFFVIFIAMRKHPGPLDDVSPLSTNRKLITVLLVGIFVLSAPMFSIF